MAGGLMVQEAGLWPGVSWYRRPGYGRYAGGLIVALLLAIGEIREGAMSGWGALRSVLYNHTDEARRRQRGSATHVQGAMRCGLYSAGEGGGPATQLP